MGHIESKNQPGAEKNIKKAVMSKINCGKIKMKSSGFFVFEKFGFLLICAVSFFLGMILAGVIVFFIKTTGIFKFLSLGVSGAKIFLFSLPLGHFFLLAGFILLAVFFAGKVIFLCGKCFQPWIWVISFFGFAIILGGLWGFSREKMFLNYTLKKNEIFRKEAIYGRISEFSGNKIIIQDEEGEKISVIPEESFFRISGIYSQRGKFLRAVGERKKGQENLFYARKIICCDED